LAGAGGRAGMTDFIEGLQEVVGFILFLIIIGLMMAVPAVVIFAVFYVLVWLVGPS
jgi:hypothetical protein